MNNIPAISRDQGFHHIGDQWGSRAATVQGIDQSLGKTSKHVNHQEREDYSCQYVDAVLIH